MTNWRYHKEGFKEILKRNDNEDDEFGSVAKTKTELIPYLKQEPCFRLLSPIVLQELEEATTFHGFNSALNGVYDYADEHLIWLGI